MRETVASKRTHPDRPTLRPGKKTKNAPLSRFFSKLLDRYEGLKRWGEESMDEYKTNLRWIDVRDEKIVVINEVLKKHRQKIAAVVNKYREAGIDLD